MKRLFAGNARRGGNYWNARPTLPKYMSVRRRKTGYALGWRYHSPRPSRAAASRRSSALDAGGSVRGINAKTRVKKLTRKELDKLTDYIKGLRR